MSLKNDLIKVSFSNFIVLLSSLVTSFVLPSILSIKGYANYKTYILYASFVGFLHFGFVDGINIKYGGISKNNLDYIEFEHYHSFFITFQILITVFILVLSLIINDEIFFLICFAIIPINLQSFFLFFYQAIGEFNLYSRSIIIVPLFNITFTLVLFFLKVIDYRAFVIVNIISYYISVFFLEIKYIQSKKIRLSKSSNQIGKILNNKIQIFFSILKYHRYIFVSGFFIMLGTVLFNLFFSTGRWITKIFTNDELFAIYSLSLSLIGIIIIFVSAINKTFYPYLHKNKNIETIKYLREILYIVSTLFISSFFLLKLMVVKFLPNYIDALPITAIVITSIPGIFIIKSIYVNIYKVEKKESQFLKDTIVFLITGITLNIAFYLYFKSLTSIAIASVITIYLWTLFPLNIKFFTIKNKLLEFTYVGFIMISFYSINTIELNYLYSFFISFISLIVINLLFFKETFFSLVKTLR